MHTHISAATRPERTEQPCLSQHSPKALAALTFLMRFDSNMAPLSHGVAPPLDSWGVSLVNDPVWKFSSLKRYQKYLLRIGWLPCMEGLPWRPLSIWTSFKKKKKSSLADVFPVELCFAFNVVLVRRSKVYSVNVRDALHCVALTLNALHF